MEVGIYWICGIMKVLVHVLILDPSFDKCFMVQRCASIEYLPIAGCVLVAGGLMLWYTGNSPILVQVVHCLPANSTET